jgi:CRISPR/Cas system-associated exonuclease Cas4 (RecB family)
MSVQQLWDQAWLESKGDIDLTNARVGGRATKANPNKEDVTFWQSQGPKWVEAYIAWRKQNSNWKIWTAPDGNQGIELALTPVVAGVPVKMIIDRVFEVNGELVIVDLKTSQNTPTSSLQLGFYKLGLEQTFGIEVKWGTYYMSRGNNISEMVDLSEYTYDKMEYLITQFDNARKSAIFLPNTNSCQYMCGLTEYCQFSIKKDK